MSQMIVKTQELTKQYGHHRAVSSISMRVRKGAVYGLIGRNGAGKTTLIRMVTGLATPATAASVSLAAAVCWKVAAGSALS